MTNRRRSCERSILVAVFTGLAVLLTAPAAGAFGDFQLAGSLSVARGSHTATLLPNGRVLVAAGFSREGEESRSELYAPLTATFTDSGLLAGGGEGQSATLLANGKVLVVGGYTKSGELATAELYDPVSGQFTLTGSLAVGRYGQTATLLRSGKVLIVGGSGYGGPRSDAELYDPQSGTFSTTGSPVNARYEQTATLLPNGKVLIAGGQTGSGATSSAELYDPANETFTATGAMSEARVRHSATLLPSGKVLIAGGFGGGTTLSSSELYDPVAGTFSPSGSMGQSRRAQTSTLLPSGKVLIAGGTDGSVSLTSVEVYDPISGTFSYTGSMAGARHDHTATLLPDGKVLMIGGFDSSSVVASAEIYDPSPIRGGFPGYEGGNGLDFGEMEGGSSTRTVKVFFGNITPLFGSDGALGRVGGDLGALGLDVTTVYSDPGGPFYVSENRCEGVSLAPGSSCTFRVQFAPFSWLRGEYTRELKVHDSTGWHALTLTGIALAPPKFELYKPLVDLTAGHAFFKWYMSDPAKITISITQPFKTTVTVKKGSRKVKKTVIVKKPVVIKTIASQEPGPVGHGDSKIDWDTKIGGKPAAKGTWTVTIKAQSIRGTATVTTPLTLT